jgi:hypothetical protein
MIGCRSRGCHSRVPSALDPSFHNLGAQPCCQMVRTVETYYLRNTALPTSPHFDLVSEVKIRSWIVARLQHRQSTTFLKTFNLNSGKRTPRIGKRSTHPLFPYPGTQIQVQAPLKFLLDEVGIRRDLPQRVKLGGYELRPILLIHQVVRIQLLLCGKILQRRVV